MEDNVSEAIEGLEPAGVWKSFADIARIPRPSKHEEKIAAYVSAQARDLGLEIQRDPVGNIVVRLPGTTGLEDPI